MRDKPFDALALVVDLETVAIDEAADLQEPAAAPSNYKDPVKVATYIEEKRIERLATAALDPNLNRIVALGLMLETRDLEPIVYLGPDEEAERKALIAFWDLVACDGNRTRTIITFNGLAFDLPTLIRRSVYLEVWPSRTLNLDKYRSPHVDLYQRLSFHGAIKGHSLRFFAQRYEFAIEAPELTGADIADLVQAGNWDGVKAHCRSDVLLSYQLAERERYILFDEEAFDAAERQRQLARRSA